MDRRHLPSQRGEEPLTSMVGLGFGNIAYHHYSGGSASTDTFMRQYFQRQGQWNAMMHHETPISADFVPAHVVDPNFPHSTDTVPAHPPPQQFPTTAEHASVPHEWIHGPTGPSPPPQRHSLPKPPLSHAAGPVPGSHLLEAASSSSTPRRYGGFSSGYGHAAIDRLRREIEGSPSREVTDTAAVPAKTYAAANQVDMEVQQARDRAMKIIQQFQDKETFPTDSEAARKRKASLDKLEQRKRLAMVRNLEYLAKAEDERLQAKLVKVHESQNYQTQWDAHHQRSLQQRLQKLGKASKQTGTNSGSATTATNSQAGIGTEQRQRAEEKRKTQQKPSDTVAIYVSNLPTDGSANEELLRALFGGLGYSLRKIHFYVHKQTGILKGDALVVYELPSSQERNTLAETVCSQMNGAELPCGTAIKVEPSDPLYKLRKRKSSDGNHYGPVSRNTEQAYKDENNDGGVCTEDNLDAFFESLHANESGDGSPNSTLEHSTINASSSSHVADTSEEKNDVRKQDKDDDLDDFFESLI